MGGSIARMYYENFLREPSYHAVVYLFVEWEVRNRKYVGDLSLNLMDEKVIVFFSTEPNM